MRHLVWPLLLLSLSILAHGARAQAGAGANASDLFKEASRLQNDGKFADALKKWQQFVKEHVKDPAIGIAYQGVGTCSLETGAHEEAIAAFPALS